MVFLQPGFFPLHRATGSSSPQSQPPRVPSHHHHCPELFQTPASSPSPQRSIPSQPSPRRVGQAACGARTASGLKPLLFHAFSASNFFFRYVLRNPSKSSQHSSEGTRTGTSVEAAPGSRRVHRSRTLVPPASRISLHFRSPPFPSPPCCLVLLIQQKIRKAKFSCCFILIQSGLYLTSTYADFSASLFVH